MDFHESVQKRILDLGAGSLSDEERAVMSVLWEPFQKREPRKITQRQIAKSQRWLGCHPKHEKDIVRDEWETTLRQVRKIIRELRVTHLIPILSSREGYWICTSKEEAQEYIQTLELQAKSQAKAWFETYKAMKESLQIQSEFFDAMMQQKL